jgi:putative ABC transport system permease protein
MSLWRQFSRGLRVLTHRRDADKDVADEVQHFIDQATLEFVARGFSPEEARRAAKLETGNTDVVREEIRARGWENVVGSLFADLRYGVRTLRKSPGFATVAILTLALGIGVNTALFQLLDALLLRTLPVNLPRQLSELRLQDTTGLRGSQRSENPVLTNGIWERIRDHRPEAFSGMFAWAEDDFNTAPIGEVHHALGLWVSGDFFRVLGVRPIAGRVFAPSDDRRGCGLPGAVISYAFWQGELGGDASVLGRKITVDYHPVTVIGITPATFTGLDVGQSFDVALPLCSQASLDSDSFLDAGTIWWLSIMGRLKPGWTREQATAELVSESPGIFEATLPREYPGENVKDYLGFKLEAYPAATGISPLRDQYERPLFLLLATAALVLLITCANLVNLLLARAGVRDREFAVRVALGALRRRLIRQLMAESSLLAGAGAGLGLLLAGALSKFMVASLSAEENTLLLDLHPDWYVLGFTGTVAIVTCLLFGLAPAVRATRVSPHAAMKAGGRGLTADRGRFHLRRILVATQLALSLVLLVSAVLFSRSLHNLMTANPGFQENGILVTDVDLAHITVPLDHRVSYKRELLDRLRAIPGVDAAADVEFLPLAGTATENLVWKDGTNAKQGMISYFNWISRQYFKTLQIPLLAGRDFDDRDTPTSPQVAIVNQALARQLGLGPNPVGKRFRRQATPSDPEMVFEVVGLVGDTKYRDIHKGFQPIVYLATAQDTRFTNSWAQILIRSNLPAAELTSRVRQMIVEINPRITTEFQTFNITVRDALLRERLMARVSGFFGFLAALLATVGLYGVMSYLVVRRTNEFGIRMTLGANRRRIVAMIMRETAGLLVPGLGCGIVLALAAGRAARALLFGLSSYDPLTLAVAIVLLTAVALAASYVPAKRAAGLDPMVALRHE